MAVSGQKIQAASDIPDKILEKVSAFPSMPKVAVELRSLLSKEDVSIDEIEKILRHDPEGSVNSNPSTNIVNLANLMCHSDGDSQPAEVALNQPYASVLDRLGIAFEQYQVFAAKARDWLKTLSDTLTFD